MRDIDTVRYEHHGTDVAVDAALKGRHWQHCLCAECALFKPEPRTGNCEIANRLYALCVEENLVAPVWECPKFVRREGVV